MQTKPGGRSKIGGCIRSGLSCRSSGYPHPFDDYCDDQVIRPIGWRETPNTTLLRALGSICSAASQLPHMAIISDGLERCGDILVASGVFTRHAARTIPDEKCGTQSFPYLPYTRSEGG